MKNNKYLACMAVFLLIVSLGHYLKGQTKQDSITLLIADFEEGKTPMKPGLKLVDWHNPAKHLEMEFGFYRLNASNPKYGKYAAKASFTQRSRRVNSWGGGGIVLEFPLIDLKKYQWLEFDMRKLSTEDELSDLRIKLEGKGNCHSVELKLTDFLFTLSEDWTHVYLPLEAFLSDRCDNENSHFSLSAANKLVTVNVREETSKGLKGTLLIDNVTFTGIVHTQQFPSPPSRFVINEFNFDGLSEKIKEDGDSFPVYGTYKAKNNNVFDINAVLLLIDEHLDGVYLQTKVLFDENGNWQSRVYPGKHIIGVIVYEATKEGIREIEKLKVGSQKIPESKFYGPHFKKIKQKIFN